MWLSLLKICNSYFSDRECIFFFFVSTGHISSEKNGVSFSVQNGDVCLHDFSGKQLVFQEKDDTGSQNSRISLRRTSKRGSLTFIEKMWFPFKQNIVLQREVEIYFNSFYIMWEDQKLILFNIWYWNFKAACNVLTRTITNWKKKKRWGGSYCFDKVFQMLNYSWYVPIFILH